MAKGFAAIGLEELLSAASSSRNDRSEAAPAEDVQRLELKELCDDYLGDNPYKAGDFVRIRKGRNLSTGGNLCVIIRTLPKAVSSYELGQERGAAGSVHGGLEYDCFCAMYHGKDIVRFWEHHADLEPE